MSVLIVYQLVSYFGKWKILHQSHWIGQIGQSILALGLVFDTPGIEVNWDSELTRFPAHGSEWICQSYSKNSTTVEIMLDYLIYKCRRSENIVTVCWKFLWSLEWMHLWPTQRNLCFFICIFIVHWLFLISSRDSQEPPNKMAVVFILI